MLLLIAVIRSETLGLFWKPYSCWSHSLCNSSYGSCKSSNNVSIRARKKLFELLETLLAQPGNKKAVFLLRTCNGKLE